jgi:hypothetical protein
VARLLNVEEGVILESGGQHSLRGRTLDLMHGLVPGSYDELVGIGEVEME